MTETREAAEIHRRVEMDGEEEERSVLMIISGFEELMKVICWRIEEVQMASM